MTLHPPPSSPRAYTMQGRVSVSDQGVALVTAWYEARGHRVQNVEHDRGYQMLDIDLLAERAGLLAHVEVKADTYDTGNLAFETVSNASKGTPGCFLYTQADVLAYVLLSRGEMLLLPMSTVRPWFVEHQEGFRPFTTSSRVGSGSYQTHGRLVPAHRIPEGLGVERHRLTNLVV